MSSDSRKTAILSLPGLCTGDLWHTTAATLLLKQLNGPSFPRAIEYVVLITLLGDARLEIVNGRVTAMYDYLTNLGITCVVAKLPAAGPSADDEHCEWAATRISPSKLGELLQNQRDSDDATFQTLWSSLSPVQLLDHPTTTTDDQPYILPPVHHYAATRILASYFSHSLAETQSYLRRTMPGQDLTIYHGAEQKIRALRKLIAKKRQSDGPGFEHARVILFIYRAIDSSPARSNEFVMNPHQNTSHDLFDQVHKEALRHGLVTIRVPHGLPAELMNPSDDLDLFDVLDGNPVIKDKRFTASFWAQVHDHVPEVFGACGGRTGSLDIAAFMGVNCFEWDEPLLNEIQRPEEERSLSANHLQQQVPQHLRLLTQRSFMSIGLLDRESFVRDGDGGGCYTKLDEELLDRWLVGRRDVFPEMNVPAGGEISQRVRAICETYLERKDIGLICELAEGLGIQEHPGAGTCNI